MHREKVGALFNLQNKFKGDKTMNETVKKYIEEKKEQLRKEEAERKEKNLIELGLYYKIYSKENSYSDEFPLYDEKINKYYKKVAYFVTDEEYEEILKLNNDSVEKTEDYSDTNPIATTLLAIAIIIYAVGLIAGLMTFPDEYMGWLGFVYWIGAFISGSSFLGFAEIIKLLHEMRNK